MKATLQRLLAFSLTPVAARVFSPRWVAWWLPSLFCLLLLLPVVMPDQHGRWFPPLNVYVGDEPHYLVVLNSLRSDHSLALRQTYDRAFDGSADAGQRFARMRLEHHAAYYVNGERKVWAELFNEDPKRLAHVPNASSRPVPKNGVDPALADAPEYSAHPMGLPLFAVAVLWPWSKPESLEWGAIILAGLCTVAGYLAYRSLLRQLSGDRFAIELTAAAVFLGSPLWFYGRSFFAEGFIAAAVVAAYAFHRTRAFLAGLALGVGVMMKPQLAILGPLLAVSYCRPRSVKSVLLLAIGPVAATLLTLWLNARMYGSFSRGPYPFYWGDIGSGAVNVLTSPVHGMLPFAPFLILAIPGFWFLRRRGLLVWQILGGGLLFFLLTAWWKYWDGGYCYGPRLMLPAIPLLGTGLVGLAEQRWGKQFWGRWALVTVVLVSALIQWSALKLGPWAINSSAPSVVSRWLAM